MKQVGKLAIIGAVKTSCVRTMQSRTYVIKHRVLVFLHILQSSKGSRIGAKHGVVKAKGSWVTLDTPAQKPRVPTPSPSLPPPRSCCWSAW